MASGMRPADAVSAINRALCHHAALGRFVTLFVAVHDPRTGRLRYTNAGHNPPIVARADGRVERLSDGGLVAGAFEQARYDGGEIVLAPGDRLCLFTDGLPEARTLADEEIGDARIVDLVRDARALTADAIVDRLFAEVGRAVGGPCQDDATAVVLAVA
jgi:sigma-B regulation protein RsbU (phosphoserine phosphatase)